MSPMSPANGLAPPIERTTMDRCHALAPTAAVLTTRWSVRETATWRRCTATTTAIAPRLKSTSLASFRPGGISMRNAARRTAPPRIPARPSNLVAAVGGAASGNLIVRTTGPSGRSGGGGAGLVESDGRPAQGDPADREGDHAPEDQDRRRAVRARHDAADTDDEDEEKDARADRKSTRAEPRECASPV